MSSHLILSPKIPGLLRLTLSERSCLCGRLDEIAASEAWSKSRIDLLTFSMASSHSFWPGALSLENIHE